jgi:hypothetical protein
VQSRGHLLQCAMTKQARAIPFCSRRRYLSLWSDYRLENNWTTKSWFTQNLENAFWCKLD